MKKIFPFVWLSFLLILLPNWVQGQNDFTETVKAHVSKNIAVAGETIWFSLNVQMPKSQYQNSKIAYAELINREGQPVAQSIHALESGVTEGFIEIPDQLESDHYLLRFYTRISPILSENGVFNQFITIINPKNSPRNSPTITQPPNYVFEDLGALADNKLRVLTRKEFTFEVPEEFKNKTVTVSVSVLNPFLPKAFHGQIDGRIYQKFPLDQPLVPEPFGHIIAAKNLNQKIDTTETFFVSAHGLQSVGISSKSNLYGDLYFELGAFRDYDFLIAQSTDQVNQLNFSPVSPFLPFKLKDDFVFPPLLLKPSDKDFLMDLILSSQVASYFYPSKNVENLPVMTGFLPDITYLLDDYTRFDDVETTLREYVPEVWVRKQAKKTLFKVSNTPLDGVFRENPLIMIDAMPVFDTDALSEFNPLKIKKLDVITREFYFNNDKFSGVISFTSFDNDFGGFELPEKALYLSYPEIQKPKKLQSPHFNMDITDPSFPDFRTTLFWFTNSKIKENLKIHTSEIKWDYVILLSVMGDGGEMNYSNKLLRVED
ncbi:hypothetical protein [Aquiflexum sp.]|uniref:hypothetical protein n=1 Tax=Aquiflexum sp. TaxID=1872584 RepID=UPI0035945631